VAIGLPGRQLECWLHSPRAIGTSTPRNEVSPTSCQSGLYFTMLLSAIACAIIWLCAQCLNSTQRVRNPTYLINPVSGDRVARSAVGMLAPFSTCMYLCTLCCTNKLLDSSQRSIPHILSVGSLFHHAPITATVKPFISESRLATTNPLVPPPIITKSYREAEPSWSQSSKMLTSLP
jgi:hypothetical protein